MALFAESPIVAVPWRTVLPLVIAGIALYLLLPKPKRRPVLIASVFGLAAVALAGIWLTHTGLAPLPEKVLFYMFSGLAIIGSAVLLTQRRPARAAISFALVVMNVCGLFLLEGAPFLMAATIIIYAGAIIVTFLFVLMLAQQKGFSDADDRSREPFLATFAGFVLLGTLLLVIDQSHPDMREFDELIDRAARASEKNSAAEIREIIGDAREFTAAIQEQDRRLKNRGGSPNLKAEVDNLDEELNPARLNVPAAKVRLKELADVGRRIQEESRPKALPAANVAGLGRVLYSDYLLPVEIGGTLLLVATIGAIAITRRRPEAKA